MSQQSQIAMYGCTLDQLNECVDEAISTPKQFALSILSDAQEQMSRGNLERARHIINQAKYILDTRVDVRPVFTNKIAK